MSVDPLAAAAGGGPNIAALIEAELQALAADAATLTTLLSVGDVVQAQVLPPNGLTDLVEIAGQRVAAALPPTLTPGDVITVQVTGFENGQVQLTILPPTTTSEGSDPLPPPSLPGSSTSSSAPATSVATSSASPSGTAAAPPQSASSPGSDVPATNTAAAAGPRPAVAPSTAVFVAASVRPAGATPPPIAPGISPEATQNPAPLPGAARVPVGPAPSTAPLGSLEARLAANRAAAAPAPSPSPAPAAITRPGSIVPPLPSRTLIPPFAGGTSRPFVAPPIFTRPTAPTVPAQNAPQAPAPQAPTSAQTSAGPQAPAGPQASAAPQGTAPRGLAVFQEPVALLRALKLPVTPTNVAAAKLALESPEKLPNALQTLERALPTSTDPRITTIRTLAAFTARLDPRSPQLATQIASYVDHIVTGSEPKLAQALVALAAAAEPLPETPTPVPSGATPAAESFAESLPETPAPSVTPGVAEAAPEVPVASTEPLPATPLAPPPVLAAAVAAERQTALSFDLKTQLLSLVATPLAGTTEALANAVSGALAALTAVQVSAASTLAANPSGLSFSLPVALPNGFAQAHVRIDRDAPEAKHTPLDGDNFHIAFVLETQRLGTVAIDLVTVGRTVTLAVKTEAALAAQAFSGAIGRLTERLEKLRYTVAKADASVVASGTTGVISTTIGNTSSASAPDPTKLVDKSA